MGTRERRGCIQRFRYPGHAQGSNDLLLHLCLGRQEDVPALGLLPRTKPQSRKGELSGCERTRRAGLDPKREYQKALRSR